MTRRAAWAVVTLVLLGAYHLMRFVAARCVGGGCDLYIPLSLLLPLLCWIAASLTGLFASADARGSGWFRALAALTLVAFIGPLLSLAVFRDRPDVFVPLASLLVAVVPLAALSHRLLTAR